MFDRFVKNFTIKLIIKKTFLFMVPWAIAFGFTLSHYPELIDMNRVVSNIFSNTLVFFMGYVLAVFGFQYTTGQSDDRDKSG